MRSHDDALEFFRARGVAATRRDWALGDTVAVPLGAGTTGRDGLTVYPAMVWLVPREDGWDVVQLVQSHERRISLASLAEACERVLALLSLHELHEECSRCGARESWSFGERVADDGLRWFVSRRCKACGHCSEADGSDALPDELRAIELARSGSWCVRLRAIHTTYGLKAVREALGLELPALMDLRRRLPCDVFTGTCAEARWILGRIGTTGVVAELVCQGS